MNARLFIVVAHQGQVMSRCTSGPGYMSMLVIYLCGSFACYLFMWKLCLLFIYVEALLVILFMYKLCLLFIYVEASLVNYLCRKLRLLIIYVEALLVIFATSVRPSVCPSVCLSVRHI